MQRCFIIYSAIFENMYILFTKFWQSNILKSLLCFNILLNKLICQIMPKIKVIDNYFVFAIYIIFCSFYVVFKERFIVLICDNGNFSCIFH